MKIPKFEFCCNADGGKKIFRLKNVASGIVSNIHLESFVLISCDGSKTNLLTADPRIPSSLSPGEEKEFICDHRELKTRPVCARELQFVFTAEDEDSNRYRIKAIKNVEDKRNYALGVWDTKTIRMVDRGERETTIEQTVSLYFLQLGK